MKGMNNEKLLLPSIIAISAFTSTAYASNHNVVDVYKTESCGCCTLWADGVKEAGFNVKVNIVSETQLMKNINKQVYQIIY